jgi:hypothetical protein
VSVSPYIRTVEPFYRVYKWSERRILKHCAVLVYTYAVFGLDVGPSVQQECHGVRLAKPTGIHQGRLTFLQRGEVVRKTYIINRS